MVLMMLSAITFASSHRVIMIAATYTTPVTSSKACLQRTRSATKLSKEVSHLAHDTCGRENNVRNLHFHWNYEGVFKRYRSNSMLNVFFEHQNDKFAPLSDYSS